ncbi:unnamed protein product [Absidia cylindrospora]
MLRSLLPISSRLSLSRKLIKPVSIPTRLTILPHNVQRRQHYGSLPASNLNNQRWNGATVRQASNESGINITDRALKQLTYIAERDNNHKQLLRVTVDSGGCHGFQNKMELTSATDEDDFVFEKDGVQVVVDGISLQYLRGSNVDFVEELIGLLSRSWTIQC